MCRNLPVSGAFHTKLMEPAKLELQDAINDVFSFHEPDSGVPKGNNSIFSASTKVFANTSGKEYASLTDTEFIQNTLTEQLVSSVHWEEILETIVRSCSQNNDQVFEVGPGKQITSMLRRMGFSASEVPSTEASLTTLENHLESVSDVSSLSSTFSSYLSSSDEDDSEGSHSPTINPLPPTSSYSPSYSSASKHRKILSRRGLSSSSLLSSSSSSFSSIGSISSAEPQSPNLQRAKFKRPTRFQIKPHASLA